MEDYVVKEDEEIEFLRHLLLTTTFSHEPFRNSQKVTGK